MAWVKASIPVKAVTEGGRPMVSFGSRMATSGKRVGLTIPFFNFSLVSDKMAMGVASLPVPAVVGIRITGTPGLGTRSIPKKLSIFPVLVIMMEVTLAIS